MEAQIQASIVQALQDHGDYAMSVPNEAKRSMALASRLKAMGMRSGVSDLVVLLPGGKAVFMEVKTATGKQSENQKRFQARVESLGFAYCIARSQQDALSFLRGLA